MVLVNSFRHNLSLISHFQLVSANKFSVYEATIFLRLSARASVRWILSPKQQYNILAHPWRNNLSIVNALTATHAEI